MANMSNHRTNIMRVLITGVNGFIGRNLKQHLAERDDILTLSVSRESTYQELASAISEADFVVHLAGVNRPVDPTEFKAGNAEFSTTLCELLELRYQETGRQVPIIFSSSIQAELGNPYGDSKREAEDAIRKLGRDSNWPVYVFRLPNVFGKWSRPNYNSVVATFCHNISQELPIQVNDPSASLTLVYVDDLVNRFIQIIDGASANKGIDGFELIQPLYTITVGKLAETIESFKKSRDTLVTEKVGVGLTRALYATYLSFLRPEQFSYFVPQHGDNRGVFVEMLKTTDSGQFSFFTAHPGITRGGHYHHTKTEKFLVIKGSARFKFRHIQTGETYELCTQGNQVEIVETVPGWTHDITNIGDEELVCMLWANEIFDRERPDTYACPV